MRARGSPGNMDLTFVDWVRDGDWHGTTVGSGFVVSIAAARCAECKTILFRY